LANANGTVKEMAEKTGIKEEAVYHLLEFLTIAGIVKKENDRYSIDKTMRTIAQLLIDFKDGDDVN